MDATCPSCQKKYRRVRPELVGKKALCACGHTFKLGQNDPQSPSAAAADLETDPAKASDSVDLSSESVFQNSYSDLDQILSGHGSTAPIPKSEPSSDSALDPASPSAATNIPFTLPAQKSKAQLTTKPAPTVSYGSTGMSVGFLAAVLSSCAAIWFSLFVLSARYSVFDRQPLNIVSQTLHDLNQGTFGELSVSVGLERSFIVLSWTIWIAAACLLCLAVGQLINAFAKLFRRRHLLPGIDGITGLTAVLLLFMLLGTIFIHFSHMRQLNRELVQNAGGQVDENTVLGRNFLELQSNHADHSRQFMTSILIASSVPLFVCLLSLSRVYITLGEPDFTPEH